MSIFTIIMIILIAFLAGMGGILDEFQFHQPLVACTLIGMVSGQLEAGVMLGGSLQMIALGWANIGAASRPMQPLPLWPAPSFLFKVEWAWKESVLRSLLRSHSLLLVCS